MPHPPARTALLLLALAAAGTAVRAQQPAEPQLIDRIAAVVGERAILLSEVDEAINERRGQGLQPPEDAAGLERLRRQVLQELIDDEVLYQAARRDTSIRVTDDEVTRAVEEQYREVRQRFRSDAELRAAMGSAGFTIDEWRRRIGEQQRRQTHITRYVQKQRQEGRLRGGSVPEAELRRAYEEAMQRTGQERPRRPPSIAFRQIVVVPRPTEAARAAALAKADSVRLAIAGGADFAAAARRFSDDLGTRDQGGDLGWFRRERMVREFADVAFNLRPGVVSPVVRTPYGFHLIMVERAQPAEVKARHILFAPQITEAEVAAARLLADSLARLARAGASMDSMARLRGDSVEPRVVGPLDRTQLDSVLVLAFAAAGVGDVIGPFTKSDDGSLLRTRVVVAQITELEEAREFTYEEVRENLRQQLQQTRAIQNLIATLRRQMYVDVRI